MIRFLRYKLNSRISITDLANKLDVEYVTAKNIMLTLLENDIVEMNFKICCGNELNNGGSLYYENIQDIPDEICENCEKACLLIKNVAVVYKVIGDIT